MEVVPIQKKESQKGLPASAVRGVSAAVSTSIPFCAPVPMPSHISTRHRRVVQVQQQAFAAVEESETEDVVVEECSERAQDDVEYAEASMAFCEGHFRAERE